MSSILILDDRSADRELLTTLLGYAGYEVHEASTGDEALDLARADPPDLIITDIVMPTMNGYEFVRRLREEPDIGKTSVVFSTANYLEDEVRRMAAACGVSHFIAKPAEPQTILNTVGEVLGSTKTFPAPVMGKEFDREQLRLLNDKLFEKVGELEKANVERGKLLAQLIKAHEDERKRIAEDLHDDSIQAVATVGMRLEMLARQTDDSELAAALERLQEYVGIAVSRLRHLLFELQPVELDSQGLAVALGVYLEQVRDEHGLQFELVDRTKRRQPSQSTRTLLYRVGQEALTNVRKHAQASCVSVVLDQYSDGFALRVTDDGSGFSPDDEMRVRAGHLGLPAMRERVEMAGGSLKLESRPGAGATLEVWLPELDRAEGLS